MANTTSPIFTPEQCQDIINMGHSLKTQDAKVGVKADKGGEGDARGGRDQRGADVCTPRRLRSHFVGSRRAALHQAPPHHGDQRCEQAHHASIPRTHGADDWWADPRRQPS